MLDRIRSDIKQDYYTQNFRNDGERFVAWYLRNVHLCDMNETRFDVTDGPNDHQIDAIHIDDDSLTVYVVQGKFLGDASVDVHPLHEVLASWVHLKNLAYLQENGNPALQRKLSEVATALEEDYKVVFELLITGQLTAAAQSALASFQEEIARSDDFTASICVVDSQELKRRYELALDRKDPLLSHSLRLEPGKYMDTKIAGTQVVVAAIPLKECLDFPGIKDGTLFQRNVRQSLGLSNPVNKGIKQTIFGDRYRDFFFFHNGVTAICDKITMLQTGQVELRGLSVVNGCQSLSTIQSCSERVKQIGDAYIMVRFYEIPQMERAERISTYTNSQTAVKPRDLRSTDRSVLNLKRSFEQRYPNGYLVTKRGETAPAARDKAYILDLSDLGKYLISWHSQRPNMAYSETRIFDKYFEQLFKREYPPENAQSLNSWMQHVSSVWVEANPLGLNESLLAMKAFAPYHHLYGIAMCFSIVSGVQEMVPNPAVSYKTAVAKDFVTQIVEIAAGCLNTALEAAANEAQPGGRVFSPQNWMKAKTCLAGINSAIRQYFQMLPNMPFPGAKETAAKLRLGLTLSREHFDYRWAAD